MDITTLLTVAGLFLSVVAGNAALFGELLFASIAVPKTLESAGFDKPTAERLFAAELAQFTRLPLILPTPNVSISSSPSVTMALAKPLQLQDVVLAIQTQIRQDVASVSAAIMQDAPGKPLSMVVTVHAPPDAPVTFSVQEPDGNVQTLVRTAAREAMIVIAPYRVALTDLSGVLTGDIGALKKAEQTALRGLAQPWDPSPQGATELVLLHNLLAVLAILHHDPDKVRHHFHYALSTPGAVRSAYGMVQLNEAFHALTERRTADARALLEKGLAAVGPRSHDILSGRLKVLEALVIWQEGQPALAEALLREAKTLSGNETEPHYYLSQLALDRGDVATANEEATAARIAARFDAHYASLAHTIYAVDVKTGAIEPRAFLPETVSFSKPPTGAPPPPAPPASAPPASSPPASSPPGAAPPAPTPPAPHPVPASVGGAGTAPPASTTSQVTGSRSAVDGVATPPKP